MKKIEKADYPAEAKRLAQEKEALAGGYSVRDAVSLFADMLETLDAMSPQIYEYFRQVQDLAKETAHLICEREGFKMQTFPNPALLTDTAGRDTGAYRQFGEALLYACASDYLLAERYEKLGSALASLS